MLDCFCELETHGSYKGYPLSNGEPATMKAKNYNKSEISSPSRWGGGLRILYKLNPLLNPRFIADNTTLYFFPSIRFSAGK
jgi:hypothetical protein